MISKEKIKHAFENELTEQEYISLIREITGVTLNSSHSSFYYDPASTKYHGANKFGLVQHSLAVYYSALRLAEAFGMKEEEIDPRACIFHDLCKAGAYVTTVKFGKQGYEYNKDYPTIQHGAESLLRMFSEGIKLTRAWALAVSYHMGAFPQSDVMGYSDACAKYKEVLLLHTADMMASKIYNR